MGFAWPLALPGLLAPLALVAAYVWISRWPGSGTGRPPIGGVAAAARWSAFPT